MATTQFNYPPRTYVAAPEFVPSEGGLLDGVEVRTVAQNAPELRGYTFESHATEVTLNDASFDPVNGDQLAITPDQDYQRKFITSGAPFTVSGSITLGLMDQDAGTVQEQAEERFLQAENIGVESRIWTHPLLKAATVLTGGPLKPTKALGLALEYIAQNYPGVPYLLAGRCVSTDIAASQLTVLPDDGATEARIKGGGVLVNGGGFFDKTGPTAASAPATATQAWLYVCGAPLLYRGPLILTPEAPKYALNLDRAFAIRTYVPAIDGPIAAVLVDLT